MAVHTSHFSHSLSRFWRKFQIMVVIWEFRNSLFGCMQEQRDILLPNNSYIKAEASEQKQLYFFSHWVKHGGQIYLMCENRFNCTWWIRTKVWIENEETFAIIQMPSAPGPLGLLFNLITISETFSQRSHCHKSYWKRAMPYNYDWRRKNVQWRNIKPETRNLFEP